MKESDEVKVTPRYYDLGLSSREQIATKLLAGMLSKAESSSSHYVQFANIKEALQYTDLLLEITRKVE